MFISVHTQDLLLYLPAGLAAPLLLFCLYRAQWPSLFQSNARVHLAAGSCLSLGLLWKMLALNINDIFLLSLNFVVSLSLIFGFFFTIIIGAISLCFLHLISPLPWENIAFHFLINVTVPASVATLSLVILERTAAKNLFLYTLGLGFIGAMAASLASGLSSLAILYSLNSTLFWPTWDHAQYFFLLAFPQGFCNGMLISALAIWQPELLKTFDEKRWFGH
ncbi:hypothetical protein [Agaribacterium sp. ZY112]|uniref:hypothetical protein n=1 Tax=Agaribacterium sp. ZY112 TaxID=3233574 RepID=UPI0035235CEA